MIYKKSLLVTVLMLFSLFAGLYAQQDAQYTQYMYNTMSVNPAYAGSRGQLSAAALYRSQWPGRSTKNTDLKPAFTNKE